MKQEISREINGIDTIGGLSTEPPSEIKLPFDLVYMQDLIRSNWNTHYIAMLLYCFKCKEPLVWHYQDESGVLFHCPKCGIEWKKNKDWKKDMEVRCR